MSARKRSLKSRVGIAVVAVVLFVCVIGGLVLRAIQKIQQGRGMEVYHNVYFMEITYQGALIYLAAIALMFAIAWIARAFGLLDQWRFRNEIRRSRRKSNKNV